MQLLSLVARYVKVTGNRAVVQLKFRQDRGFQPVVRILADEIEGEFLTYPLGKKDEAKKLEAAAKDEALSFFSYSCNAEGLIRTQGKLPLSMLDLSMPLYQLITASFDLAVGVMRQPVPDAEEELFARSILKWLTRWAAYPSPYLARLFEAAATLNRFLPFTNAASQTVRIIPPRAPDVSLQLAYSQQAVAEKYETDRNFQDIRDDLHEVVGEVVNAWISRDEADSSALDQEIKSLKALVEETKKAVQSAAKEMENQKFETTLQGIDLEVELEKDKIKQIVKASFQILGQIIQLGGAIASMGANPGAATMVGNANPFTIINTLAAQAGQPTLGQKALGVLILFYALPVNLISEYRSMNPKDKKAFNKALGSAIPAVVKLLDITVKLLKINKPLEEAEEIGHMVSKAAAVPNAVEAKAVWDAFEVEATNQLSLLTRDPEESMLVVRAATDYKTCVQKYAIYGRMYCEQQAVLAQLNRELGTLLIRKAAAQQKQEALRTLQKNLTNKDEAVATLNRFRQGRLYELRQSFFAALYRYRAAYFYKNLDLPAKMPPFVLPTSAAEMKEILNDIETAKHEAVPVTYGDFSKVKVINRQEDPGFFANLETKKEAKFQIDLHEKEFANHTLVRLNRVHTWLVGAGKTPTTLELLSGSEFQDRSLGKHPAIFSGQPVSIAFSYEGDTITYDPLLEGVCPTPFADWTLRVHTDDLNLSEVTQVRIEMLGKSVMKL